MSVSAYKVAFTSSAKKDFDRLPAKIQDRVVEAVRFLAENPLTELLKIKKLKGAESLYRVRVGDYRLIYEVRSHILLVLVIKIGHRREIYRHL